MNTNRPTLPTLTVNRQFLLDFVAEEAPCLGFGLVEVEGSQCTMLVLRLNQPLPNNVSAAGFNFGHRFIGGDGWEVVHFGFEFYGFATYNVLINPSDPAARQLLRTMMETGDYFFFALDSDRSTTAFRSDVSPANLIWLKVNIDRIEASTTTALQYDKAVSLFAKQPDPPGTMLTWVCRNNLDYLNLADDPLTMSPA